MTNKFNARGHYVCIDCGRHHSKTGKKRPECEPGHWVTYFGSTKELKHWNNLKLLERAGEIRNLTLHPVFKLIVNGQLIGKYTGDASYFEGNQSIVDDVKGHMNGPQKEAFTLRKKLTEAIYGVQVRVV